MISSEQLAETLNGNQTVSMGEKILALDSGLVAVFVGADGILQFCGAISASLQIMAGGVVAFSKSGENFCDANGNAYRLFDSSNSTECVNFLIATFFGKEEPTYKISSQIPHKSFTLYSGSKEYCRGIIFNVKDLK